MAGPQLKIDDAGNVWDVSSGTPVFVHGPQSGQSPQVVMPAAPKDPPKPDFIPGHPNLTYDPKTNSAKPIAGVPNDSQTTYRTLSPQEIKAHGLDPNHAWQTSSSGDLKDLGPTSAGSQDTAKKQAALEATRNLVQSLQKARGLVSNWSTGFGGYMGQKVPWSDQANQLDTVINQEIRGNIFKNWVDTMKAQSDTGGTGIGRIMQSEIPLVTGSLGALDPVKMGKDGTLQSLDQIEQRVLRGAAAINGENQDDPKVIQKYRLQFGGLPAGQNGDNNTPPAIGPAAGGQGGPPPPAPPVGPGGVPHADYSAMVGGPGEQLAVMDPNSKMGALHQTYRNEYDPAVAGVLATFIRHGTSYDTAAAYLQSHGFIPPKEADYAAGVSYAKQHGGAVNVGANRLVPTTFGERMASSPVAAGLASAASAGTAGFLDTAGRHVVGPAWDANRAALAQTNPGSDLLGNVAGGAGAMLLGGELLAPRLAAGAKGGLARTALAFAARNPIKAGAITDALYGGIYGANENPDAPLTGAAVGTLAGGGGGMFGGLASKGVGNVFRGVRDPAIQRLQAAGIPLTAGEVLGPGAKKVQDALTSLPGPGTMVSRRYAEGRQALNQAAFNQAGDIVGAPINNVGQAGIRALDAAKNRAYSSALDPVNINIDTPEAISGIVGAMKSAKAIPNVDQAGDLAYSALENYIGQAAPNGQMTGNDFQQAYRGLSRTARQSGNRIYGHEIGQALGQGQDALVGALQDQAPGAYEAFLRANRANRHLSVLSKAVDAAKNQIGDNGEPLFTPAQLSQASSANARTYNGAVAAASGQRPFNQLAMDAQRVMSSQLPESGTFPRQIAGMLATGSIAGAGGMFGGHEGGASGAAEGAAVPLGMLTLLGTRGGQKLLTEALIRRSIADQVAGRAMIRNPQVGGTILTAAGVPTLLGPQAQ